MHLSTVWCQGKKKTPEKHNPKPRSGVEAVLSVSVGDGVCYIHVGESQDSKSLDQMTKIIDVLRQHQISYPSCSYRCPRSLWFLLHLLPHAVHVNQLALSRSALI